ncbi:hypothetical protein BaRGS_00037612, partial [Batillaria attramentaria]
MPSTTEAMSLLQKSPTGSGDNSAAFLDTRKGANSRASSSPSSRTGGSSTREKRTVSALPGPVPHGNSMRNVVYYQNRFIVIDTTPATVTARHGAHAANHHAASDDHVTSAVNQGHVGGASGNGGSALQVARAGRGKADDSSKQKAASDIDGAACVSSHQMAALNTASNAPFAYIDGTAVIAPADDTVIQSRTGIRGSAGTRRLEMDASSVSMDGRGIEIIVSDETGVSHRPADKARRLSGKRALLKKIGTVLIDNRMTGKENCEQLLTEHPEEYRVLKKVLNYMFVTVGVALLVSVFVVILYTCI